MIEPFRWHFIVCWLIKIHDEICARQKQNNNDVVVDDDADGDGDGDVCVTWDAYGDNT